MKFLAVEFLMHIYTYMQYIRENNYFSYLECWTHEESKGWRKVNVGSDQLASSQSTPDTEKEPPKLIEMDSPSSNDEPESTTPVRLVKTSCGDAHNIGLDDGGNAYSLPSPLEFDPFPSGSQHKVTEIVCGKEHSLLLTEHGQGNSHNLNRQSAIGTRKLQDTK